MKNFEDIKSNFRLKVLAFQNAKAASTIKKVCKNHLTYLEIGALCDLVSVAITNEKNHTEGIIIEAGCALGGSAIALAGAKNEERKLFIYDVFEMIPPPSSKDGQDVYNRYETIVGQQAVGLGGKNYYGYEKNLYDQVLYSFATFGFEVERNNIHLVKGLYEDTLQVDRPVSLAHIDCDWYESVLTCLTRIEPNLVSGGTLVIDDYYVWSGCRAAVDEYFGRLDRDKYKFVQKSRLHISKK